MPASAFDILRRTLAETQVPTSQPAAAATSYWDQAAAAYDPPMQRDSFPASEPMRLGGGVPELDRLRNAINSLPAGLASVGVQPVQTAARVGSQFGSMADAGLAQAFALDEQRRINQAFRMPDEGTPGIVAAGKPPDLEGNAVYRTAKQFGDWVAKTFPRDPRLAQDFLATTLPEAIGQVGGYLGLGLLTGPVGPIAAGMGQESQAIYEEARAAGKTPEKAQEISLSPIVAAIGASEAIPIGKTLTRLNKLAGGKLSGVWRKALASGIGGLEELLQEGVLQTIPENLYAKSEYDPDRKWYEGVVQAGGAGGIAGFLANAFVLSLAGKRASAAHAKSLLETNRPAAERIAATDKPSRAALNNLGLPTNITSQGSARADFAQTIRDLITQEKVNAESPTRQVVPPSGEQGVLGEPGGRLRVRDDEQGGGKQAQAPIQAQGEAQAQAQEESGAAVLEQGPPLGIVPPWTAAAMRRAADKVPVEVKPPAAAKGRIEAAYGTPKPGWWEKVKEVSEKAKNVATRHFEYLDPKQPSMAPAIDTLRRAQDIHSLATDFAVRTLRNETASVNGPKQHNLLNQYVVAHNALRTLETNEALGPSAPKQMLPYGLESDPAGLRKWAAETADVASKVPAVQAAIDERNKINLKVVTDQVNAGLLPKEALANAENYLHQQVVMADRLSNIVKGVQTETKSGYQRKRSTVESASPLVGRAAEIDPNSNYLEAEFEFLRDADTQLRKAAARKEIEQTYDISEALKKQAEALAANSGTPVDWHELVDTAAPLAGSKGYTIYQWRPGHPLFKATTIPERIAEKLQAGILSEYNLKPDDLRSVLALAGPYPEIVIPVEIAQQLEDMRNSKPAQGALAALDRAVLQFPTQVFKSAHTTLNPLNPLRIVPYSLRNLSGDGEVVLTSAPGALKYVPRAASETWRYYFKQGEPSADLQEAINNSVLDAGFTAQETFDPKYLRSFERFFGPEFSPKHIPAEAYDAIKRFHEFRESVLRYATYLYYKNNPSSVTGFGASRRAAIEEIERSLGRSKAAAKLSRDLVGDYGARSIMTTAMRKRLVPFMSFMEINATRYPRMIANAIKEGQSGRLGKILGPAMALRLAIPTAALYAWNQLVMGDIEDELTPDEQADPHVTLGRTASGTPLVLRNVGAFGDFVEWFGLEKLATLAPMLADDQISWGTLAKELAKTPISKLVNGLGPTYTLPMAAAGLTTYPDPLNPRPTDRLEAVAGTYGLRDVAKEVRGRISKSGERSRPEFVARNLAGVSDNERNALHETYALMDRFRRSKGVEREAHFGKSTIQYLREAADGEDFEAFQEARRAYMASGGTYKKFKQSLDRIDPLHGGLNQKLRREFMTNYITDIQRERVKLARRHARELEITLMHWWGRSYKIDRGQDDPGDEKRKAALEQYRKAS